MSLKVRIYMSTAKYHWERDVLRRWYDGIKFVDDSTVDVRYCYADTADPDTDIGIVYGGIRPAKGIHDIRRAITSGCKTFIMNETPLLGRTISNGYTWHRVGVGSHLHGEGDFNCENSPPDRLNKYQEEWQLKFAPWESRGKHVVVGLQLPGDSSLRKQDISEWAIAIVDELLKNTGKHIKIRTHPAFGKDDHSHIIELYKHVGMLQSARVSFSYGNIVPWEHDLENCHCVITYSSGLAIDAIDHGIPVIAMDHANFAYDISSHYISDIQHLKKIPDAEKQQWYNNLSYCQWSNDEIVEGLPWLHLRSTAERIIR